MLTGVDWHPAVPPEKLVPSLAFADIGLYVSAGETGQQQVALPNKIFEYTAAGLAVLTMGRCDAQAILARHGHGLAHRRYQPSGSRRRAREP